MNSYLAHEKTDFRVALEIAPAFPAFPASMWVANLRNSQLLRAIRALKELNGSVLRVSRKAVKRRDALNNSIFSCTIYFHSEYFRGS